MLEIFSTGKICIPGSIHQLAKARSFLESGIDFTCG